mmetsp:Transcript_50476/g.134213  ORF Transcript_50476/g.134213 Transcript_50476/m.134213 type:complete len:228 (+) Transcript_50476:1124-1807(+)
MNLAQLWSCWAASRTTKSPSIAQELDGTWANLVCVFGDGASSLFLRERHKPPPLAATPHDSLDLRTQRLRSSSQKLKRDHSCNISDRNRLYSCNKRGAHGRTISHKRRVAPAPRNGRSSPGRKNNGQTMYPRVHWRARVNSACTVAPCKGPPITCFLLARGTTGPRPLPRHRLVITIRRFLDAISSARPAEFSAATSIARLVFASASFVGSFREHCATHPRPSASRK